VTIIGWLAFALGVLAAVLAVMGLWVSPSMAAIGAMPREPGVTFPYWLFQHFAVIACAHLVLALTAIVAGFALVRLRTWARAWLEGLAWLSLAWVLGFGALWLRTAVSIAKRLPPNAGLGVPPVLFVGMGAFVVIFTLIPIIYVIRVLRGRQVREVMAPGSPA
jgi:hypothetical protein